MSGYLIFDDIDSRNYDAYVSFVDIDSTPKRVYTKVDIAGKNGSVLIDEKKYDDATRSYDCVILDESKRRAFVNALMSKNGYFRLTDGYNTDEFYKAVFEEDIETKTVRNRSKYKFRLTFTRKPQRFLISGEDVKEIGEWGEITTKTGEKVTFEADATTGIKSIESTISAEQNGEPWKSGENVAPYLLRRSPQFDSPYDREIDELVGGTVAWNQLVQNGNFASKSIWTNVSCDYSVSNNVATITASAQYGGLNQNGQQFIANHKYLMSFDFKGSASALFEAIIKTGTSSTLVKQWDASGSKEKIAIIFNSAETYSGYYYPARDTRSSDWDAFELSSVMLIDLTQMFGSTIADYIYSLEQTTAGAGVAWLKEHGFFTKDYYAYNTGSLLSVKTSAHKTVGFNQLSASENTINTSAYSVALKGDLGNRIIGGIDYCISFDVTNVPSGGRSVYINEGLADNTVYSTFINITANGHYSQVFRAKNVDAQNSYPLYKYGGATTQSLQFSNVCINISKTTGTPKNGDYVEYEAHSYPLDSDLELRGLFKLDANNNLYCDGDVYESSNAVTRKYGIVDLGTLNYTAIATDTENVYRMRAYGPADIKPSGSASNVANIICSKYRAGTNNDTFNCAPNTVNIGASTTQIIIYDPNYNTSDSASDLEASLSGVYLVYELATPTTETANAFTVPQIVDPDGTEEYIDTRSVPVPVGHRTTYHEEADISGKTEVKVYVSPTQNQSDADVYTKGFGGTVYGGTIDIISGLLTGTMGYIQSYDGETIGEPWMSSLDPYVSGTTPTKGAEVVYTLTTPTTTQLSPTQILPLLGTNYVWSDISDVTVQYGANPNMIGNPTLFDAKPLIKVTGKGVLGLGDYNITITGDADQVIYIDCDSMEIYKLVSGVPVNASNLVSFATNEFPVLPKGVTSVSMGTGITGCEITPRWWRI